MRKVNCTDIEYWRPSTNCITPHETNRWIDDQTCVFGIGSCFALNMHRWLRLHGIAGESLDGGMHYNPATILYELRGISGRTNPVVSWNVASEDGEQFVDALRHPVAANSIELLEVRRREISERAKRAFFDANSFFITFGLSEVWEQRTEEFGWITLNRVPPKAIRDENETRNRFLSVDEIQVHLKEIVEIVRQNRGDAANIIFTVSPIPLKVSSLMGDPRIANVRSKANLLAALHQFNSGPIEHVMYFPAYEFFFGGGAAEGLWQTDGRHPTRIAIEQVCTSFVNAYAKDPRRFERDVNFDVPLVP
jgi:hypothetical protein